MAKTKEDISGVDDSVEALLTTEKETSRILLNQFRAIAPVNGIGAGDYYSRTLLDRARTFSYPNKASHFINSLGYILEANKGKIQVSLRKGGGYYGMSENILTISNSSDVRLDVARSRRTDLMEARLVARSCFWLPSSGSLASDFSGKHISEELANQTCSNAVLKLLIEDLDDNKENWKIELHKKRNTYLENLKKSRGKDVWAITRSIARLAEISGDTEYMMFAPVTEQQGGHLVLYTTATLTQRLSEEFSGNGFGSYYPTEFRSSNAKDAFPVMITPYHLNDSVTVEVRGIKRFYNGQEAELRSSLSTFMYGEKDSTIFKIFPHNYPDGWKGIDTTLVAVNPIAGWFLI